MPFVRNLGKTNCLTHIPQDINIEFSPLNVTVVGTPTNNVGVVSGFSTSNYLTLPEAFNPENKDWEIVISLTTGSSVTGGSYNQVFYNGGYNSSKRTIWAFISTSGLLGVGLGNGGSDWISYLEGSSAVKPNTHYLVKIIRNGNTYSLSYSDNNGETYNTESTIEFSHSIPSYTPYLGTYVGSSNNYSFQGSIHLNESYIKVNGETWWKGGTGALTLKAGSKVYVPNGFEEDGVTPKFDEVVVESDVVKNDFGSSTAPLILTLQGENYLYGSIVSDSGSGTSTSSTNGAYYRTDNNFIYPNNNSSGKKQSLPIVIVTGDGKGNISSIDQVFNGFGYIGSTAFALPGVKGLMSNGWYENGTLRNKEYTIDRVTLSDLSAWVNLSGTENGYLLKIASDVGNYELIFQPTRRFYSSLVTPTQNTQTNFAYIEDENQWYFWAVNATSWVKADVRIYGDVTLGAGSISKFTPKPVGGKNRTKLYQLVKPKRTYFKYGNEIDASVVGSFGTVVDGVASGFGTSTNYLKVPDKLQLSTASSWEMVVKFKFKTHSDSQKLFSEFSVSKPSGFGIDTDNLLTLNLSNDRSSNNIDSMRTTTVLKDGETYWAKAEFTGSAYNLYLSTDGVDYKLENTVSSTEKLQDCEWSIGVTGVSNYFFPFKGLIYLSESYVKINGQDWWNGSDYIKVGSWVDEGVVNGFSSGNYLLTPKSINLNSVDTWEIVLRTKYGLGSLLQQHSNSPYTIAIRCGMMLVNFSGSAWTDVYRADAGLVEGEWYSIRASFDGSIYKFERAEDGGEYVVLGTLENSTKITSNNQAFILGTNDVHTDPNAGSIDLTQSYIKINGETWWHGTKAIESTKNDFVYYTDRLLSYSPILKTGKHYVTLFESSTGGTYDVIVPQDSKARIAIVGGGGAAAIRGVYDDKGYGWSGGSGGAFVGEFMLPAGVYSVTVGSANNNTSGQGGNTATLNPSDTSTHDSYITGVVRVGGGGSGHYNSSYVGAAGASATFEIEPLTIELNTAGKAGNSGSGGKGSAAAATVNGGTSVYKGYGQGQGCKTSEYANKRSWINGTNGFVRIELWSETEIRSY